MKVQALLLICTVLGVALGSPSNFEKCLQEGANAWAREYGTSIRFVDPWHKRSEDQQYPYWVEKSSRIADYFNVNTGEPQPNIAFTTNQDNDACTTTNVIKLNKEYSYTNTFTVSLTETLVIENTVEVSVSIPEVGGIKDTTKISTSVSSTQSVSSSDTSKWQVTEDIPIAPREHKQVTVIISTQSFSADYHYVVDFSGHVPIWFESKIDFNRDPGQGSDFHWLWFVPVSSVLNKGISTGSPYCSGFTAWPAQFTGRGHIEGLTGVNIDVKTVTTPLGPCPYNSPNLKSNVAGAGAAINATVLSAKPTIVPTLPKAQPVQGPKSKAIKLPAGAKALAASNDAEEESTERNTERKGAPGGRRMI